MKLVRLLLLLFVCFTVLAQTPTSTPAAQPSVQLPPDLARVLTDYESAWNKNDPAELSKLFAEDGLVLANGAPMVKGRAADRKGLLRAEQIAASTARRPLCSRRNCRLHHWRIQ